MFASQSWPFIPLTPEAVALALSCPYPSPRISPWHSLQQTPDIRSQDIIHHTTKIHHPMYTRLHLHRLMFERATTTIHPTWVSRSRHCSNLQIPATLYQHHSLYLPLVVLATPFSKNIHPELEQTPTTKPKSVCVLLSELLTEEVNYWTSLPARTLWMTLGRPTTSSQPCRPQAILSIRPPHFLDLCTHHLPPPLPQTSLLPSIAIFHTVISTVLLASSAP